MKIVILSSKVGRPREAKPLVDFGSGMRTNNPIGAVHKSLSSQKEVDSTGNLPY